MHLILAKLPYNYDDEAVSSGLSYSSTSLLLLCFCFNVFIFLFILFLTFFKEIHFFFKTMYYICYTIEHFGFRHVGMPSTFRW